MNQWWKEKYVLQVGESGFWQIGPLRIRVARAEKELFLQWLQGGDALTDTVLVEVPSLRADLGGDATINRIGVQRTDGIVSLRPLLSDRTIVVNPESAISLPGHEEMVMYIASPLWIEVSIGKTPKKIGEIPTYRLSDTWFGSSTVEGELCYASKTSARREIATLPLRHHQAYTAVKIQNKTDELLVLENLRLPVPLLSLFVARDGRFWTNTVNFVREEEESGSMAILRLGESPPAEVTAAVRMAKPREKQEQNILVRAFGGLIR